MKSGSDRSQTSMLLVLAVEMTVKMELDLSRGNDADGVVDVFGTDNWEVSFFFFLKSCPKG